MALHNEQINKAITDIAVGKQKKHQSLVLIKLDYSSDVRGILNYSSLQQRRRRREVGLSLS